MKEIRNMVQEKILLRAAEIPYFVCPRNIFLAYREQETKHTNESDKTENHWDKISITLQECLFAVFHFVLLVERTFTVLCESQHAKCKRFMVSLKTEYFNMRDCIQGRATVNQPDSSTFC